MYPSAQQISSIKSCNCCCM